MMNPSELLLTSSVLILAVLALRHFGRGRLSMVMIVCLLQPVSGASRSVSWVMVAGDLPQSWFISFHSPSDSGMCAIAVPSFRIVDSCLPDISIPER